MARVVDSSIPPITNSLYGGIYGSPAGGILGLGGGVPTPSLVPPISAARTTVPPQNPMTPLTSQAGPGPMMMASLAPNPAPAVNTAGPAPFPPVRPPNFGVNATPDVSGESPKIMAPGVQGARAPMQSQQPPAPAPAPAQAPAPPMPPVRPSSFPIDQNRPTMAGQPIAHVAGPNWLRNFFLAGQPAPTGMTGLLNAQRGVGGGLS